MNNPNFGISVFGMADMQHNWNIIYR